MQITLNQREIESAVRRHIVALLGVAAGASFAIEFTSGRAPNGLTATVDLNAAEDAGAPMTSAPVVQAQPVATNPAPAVSASPATSPIAAAFAPEVKEVAQPAATTPAPVLADAAPVTTPPATPGANDGIKLFG